MSPGRVVEHSGLLSAFLQRRRLRRCANLIDEGQLLDFGCGNGALAAHVAPKKYLGLDPNESALRTARRHFPRHTFASLGLTDLERGQFDWITALAVIEHVEDPVLMLSSARRLLRPSGYIVVTTPSWGWKAVHDCGAKLGLFSRSAAAEHKAFLGRKDLARLAGAAGFQVVGYRRFLAGANQEVLLKPR